MLGTAITLGFRHGIDWDHIAAITDITSSATTGETDQIEASGTLTHGSTGPDTISLAPPLTVPAVDVPKLALRPLGLASLYALGHALVVVVLGLAALLFQAILPEWVDPLMERVVGVTLLLLGFWVVYSLIRYWRGEGEFRLQSRWMVVFSGVRRLRQRLEAATHPHAHDSTSAPHMHEVTQYGPRMAFGVGMIHGIGAETGTQVLIIAAVGGAASQGLGVWMLLAFVLGLLGSNTLVALMAASGYVGSQRAKTLYVAVGCLTAIFSLIVGSYFVLGHGGELPDLQQLTAFLGGQS